MDDRALEGELGTDPLFGPDRGVTIAAPEGIGPGNWAGAPGAAVVEGDVVLTYRLRAPAPQRGHTLVIARSADGVRFQTVRRISRDDLAALSIERSAIVHTGGVWRLFISFVATEDRRWRIEAVEGDTLDGLDTRSRRPVLIADEIGVAGVKDPWLRRIGETWHLFTSFGLLPGGAGPELHATGDALSTGRTGSLSGLATSRHGISWHWRGAVLEPSPERWDGYTARLTTALRWADGWIGLLRREHAGGELRGALRRRLQRGSGPLAKGRAQRTGRR